jgi:hypothetical protein
MSTLTTYSPARGFGIAAEAKGPNLLQRFVNRVVEARMHRAEAFLQRHSHLIPHELDRADWRFTPRSEDSLPFRRR